MRPLLRHASPVWSPSNKGVVDKVEAVRRRFTKKIPELSSHSYEGRLSLLGIQSLEARRTKAYLIYVYKLLCNLVDSDSGKCFSVIEDNNGKEVMPIKYM